MEKIWAGEMPVRIFLMMANIVNYEKMKKVIFKTPEALACALAEQLVNISCGRKIIHVALSGGSTPKLLFKILASTYKNHDWSRVHFYWGMKDVGPIILRVIMQWPKTLFEPVNISNDCF